MSLKNKMLISIFVSGLSILAIIYAWSPLLITYVPVVQAYDFPIEQAELVESILSSRSELQTKALELTSILMLVHLAITLALIWLPEIISNAKHNKLL